MGLVEGLRRLSEWCLVDDGDDRREKINKYLKSQVG